jgi:superoxide reductase
MAKKDELYKCDTCGNLVMVLEGGDGDLVCCGANMRKLEATSDLAKSVMQHMGRPGTP